MNANPSLSRISIPPDLPSKFGVGRSMFDVQIQPVLHHGDCLLVLPTLPDGSIDLVVTSPPYNLGINYRSFDDTAGRGEFLEWCRAWAAEVKRH